jgi:alkylation response protein AidB-like acyl-CoA dehydrogenase
MGIVELDLNLTDEQKAIRDAVRKFGAEVMRPAAKELDLLADPQDVIAPNSVLWDVFRAYRKLGLHRRGFPEECGGIPGDDIMAGILLREELSYAACDLSVSLSVSSFPFRLALLSPDPEVRDWTRQYCEDAEIKMIGCWGMTEPDHGSDWIMAGEPEGQDPRTAPQVRAVKKGNEYIINGQKSAWVSNGTIATHTAMGMGIDHPDGRRTLGYATMPLNLPGVSRGKPLNKLGQRALNQGEIYFENVRIPESMMIVADMGALAAMPGAGLGATLATANAGMAISFASVARAAFDEALRYAQERVQGGKPIIEHQNIQLKLFDMFKQMEAARSLARRINIYNAVMPPSLPHSIAAKVFSTETAFKVASEAVQIFGGYGLCKDYLIEKLFRDARAAMIEDGANDTLSLVGARILVD